MKYVSWLITLPLTALFLLFVLSNRDVVALTLWPFATIVTAPLYLFFMATVFVSFVAGLTVMWLMQHKYRANARKWRREAESLKAVVLEPAPTTRAISQS